MHVFLFVTNYRNCLSFSKTMQFSHLFYLNSKSMYLQHDSKENLNTFPFARECNCASEFNKKQMLK